MKNIGLITLSIAIVFVGILGFMVANNFHSSYQKRIEDQARHECAQVSRVEVRESENIKGFYTAEDVYNKCLKEKGL